MPTQETHQHARRVLATVDSSYQLFEAYRSFLASPGRQATVAGNNDRDLWILARIKDLCGAKSFTEALKHPDFLTLLAFGYLGFARRPDLSFPRVRRSMLLPKAVAGIEPDFFPILLKEIRSHAAQFPSFGIDVKAAEQTVKQLISRLGKIPDVEAPKRLAGQPSLAAAAATNQSPGDAIPFLVLIFVIYGVIAKVKDPIK